MCKHLFGNVLWLTIFCALVLFDFTCDMDHESVINYYYVSKATSAFLDASEAFDKTNHNMVLNESIPITTSRWCSPWFVTSRPVFLITSCSYLFSTIRRFLQALSSIQSLVLWPICNASVFIPYSGPTIELSSAKHTYFVASCSVAFLSWHCSVFYGIANKSPIHEV